MPITDVEFNCLLQSHLYGIEILIVIKNAQETHTPIAPLWNWNKLATGLYQGEQITPIAPLWNWNFSCYFKFKKILSTPIAPLWNWNKKSRLNAKFVYVLQSHLYGIEMGEQTLTKNFGIILQSHLYGIEIGKKKLISFVPLNSNRTFMELKYVYFR